MHTGLQFDVKSINECYSKYANTLRDIVQIPNNRCLYVGLEFHLEFYLEFGRSQFINSLSVYLTMNCQITQSFLGKILVITYVEWNIWLLNLYQCILNKILNFAVFFFLAFVYLIQVFKQVYNSKLCSFPSPGTRLL